MMTMVVLLFMFTFVSGVICWLTCASWILVGSFMYNIGRQSGKRYG